MSPSRPCAAPWRQRAPWNNGAGWSRFWRVQGPVPAGEALRALRALEVLERVATPESAQVLAAVARGAPEARLTREAHASLGRLGKATSSAP
jgi:hypothetical protein